MRDGWLAHVKPVDDFAGTDRFPLRGNQPEDLQAGTVSQGLEPGQLAGMLFRCLPWRQDHGFAARIDWL